MNLKDLDSFVLEDILTSDHPSSFTKRDSYALLILRLPEVNSEIKLNSYAFIIEKNSVQIYNRDAKELESLGTLDKFIDFLDNKIDKLLKNIQQYHIEIDNLEESLYDSHIDKKFMEKWLNFKKNTSLINRLMFHSTIAIELFVNYLKKNSILDYNEHALVDVIQEMNRVKDLSKSALDKLDNLYDFYRAKVDEKMNRNVYYLTLLSGLFLPLTLVTGFFGMNTGGLPFTDDSYGTLKVVVISIILELLFFLPFFILNSKNRSS
jgi:magnesium transporter